MKEFTLTEKEAVVLDKIAEATKMDCWFRIEDDLTVTDIEGEMPNASEAELVAMLEEGLGYGLDQPQSGGLSPEEIKIAEACFARARLAVEEERAKKPVKGSGWKLKDVGFYYSTLTSNEGVIRGTCTVYGEDGDGKTVDDREFLYRPAFHGVAEFIKIRPLDGDEKDPFSRTEYAKAEEILLENIHANMDAIHNYVDPHREDLKKLEDMVKAKKDITACVALFLDLYEDTDVMHRDVVEKEIEELRNGDDENNMEAGRLELMLKDNPEITYFDYYAERPIDFDWLRKRLGLSADNPYEKAICVLSDNGFGQDLTSVLIACACRNAIDAFEEEEEIMRTPFGEFCDVVSGLWVDCEDGTCVCRIADMLVQWIIKHPGDYPYPTSFFELKEWAESEGGF